MAVMLICFWGMAVVFGGIGGGLLYYYFQQRRKAQTSSGWPATEGKIVRSWVKTSTSWDSDYRTRTTAYYPAVQYEYTVLGKTYTGSRISFGGTAGKSTRRAAEAALEGYPVGASVTVYYNPHNPQDAVLERTMHGGPLMLIVGATFGASAVCLFLTSLLLAFSK